MILPIVAYGDPVLRQVAKDVSKDNASLSQLISDMKETLKNSGGVGLAAPQVGESVRVFLVDGARMSEEFQKTFINAKITDQRGDEWEFEEGCLSIPRVRAMISRKYEVDIEYLDENFEPQKETYTGILARIIQHEYDHIEGKLFIDKMTPLKRKIIIHHLVKISKGEVETKYEMKQWKPTKSTN
jgi:peptide deformylase